MQRLPPPPRPAPTSRSRHIGLIATVLVHALVFLAILYGFNHAPPPALPPPAAANPNARPPPPPAADQLPPALRPVGGLPPALAWQHGKRLEADVYEATAPGSPVGRIGLYLGRRPDFSPSTLDRALFNAEFLGQPVLWYLTKQTRAGVVVEALTFYQPGTYGANGAIHLWVHADSLDSAKAAAKALSATMLLPAPVEGKAPAR